MLPAPEGQARQLAHISPMLFASLLRRLVRFGRLTVIDPGGRVHRIKGADGPSAVIRLHDSSVGWAFVLNPALALGEAYMAGRLTIEEGTLFDFLTILIVSRREALLGRSTGLAACGRKLLGRFWTYNPVGRAHRRVSHHYDLAPGLFDLFLDSDRQYSCAYFALEGDDLETAQRRKKAHLAAKLLLRPGDRVLDIGSGWGGLGLYLADCAAVDVTGVTLSREQHELSNARAVSGGLSERVRFRLRDYREEEGCYERIVSVGMLEHVGLGHYREFFGKVRELLTDDGVALVHTIGRYDTPGPVNPWILRYIFPGAYVPTLSELMPAIEEQHLLVTDIEVLKRHYAKTLRAWRTRFVSNWDRARSMYDERFCRMWEFYLTACEVGFLNNIMTVFQIQLAKDPGAVPETRDYIHEFEEAH